MNSAHAQRTSSSNSGWQHFPHAADMGVRGWGATLEEAFANAALAMVAIICAPESVEPREIVDIRCEAPDRELLLVDWLNALVYEMSVRQMLFGRFDVSITDGLLQATAWGESIDRARHQPAVEVKGATYTELKVVQTPDYGWLAQCVVDV